MGVDRTSDLILIGEVFHAMHVILHLKLGNHKGLALQLLVLPVILIQIPIHAFLSPFPAYC